MAYFIRHAGRHAGDDCAIIALHPDDCEEVIARWEDLCVNKTEALRIAAPALPSTDAGPAPAAPERKKHGGAAAGVQILSHATCRPRRSLWGTAQKGRMLMAGAKEP